MATTLTKAQRQGRPPKFIAKRLLPIHQAFIDEIVWNGLTRQQAASHVGITDAWSRALMNSPLVIKYMNEQLDVRRKGERPRNFHRLTELRDQNDNKAAAVSAIKVLEQIDDEVARAGGGDRNLKPGFIVKVTVNNGVPQGVSQRVGETIDAKPLIEQGDDVNDQLSAALNDVVWIDGTGEGEA